MESAGAGTSGGGIVADLRRAVADTFGAEASTLADPHKLAGGTMHDIWSMQVALPGESRDVVIRTSPRIRDDLTVPKREFEAISESRRRGVTAPPVYGVGATADGEPYLVMGRVTGDANPRPLLRDPAFEKARSAMIRQLADSLAKIHGIAPDELPITLEGPLPGEDPLATQLRQLQQKYDEDRLQRYPVLEWTLRWLRRQAEARPVQASGTVLVHGDFRIGNIMYDEAGLTAVLDWEAVHAGDPMEDLAWFCVRVWRFSRPDLPAGGLASRDDWLEAYERVSGTEVDRPRFALWEILCNLRWAIVTLNQVKTHLDGTVRSQELAAIGRRTSETELEILRLVQAYKEGP